MNGAYEVEIGDGGSRDPLLQGRTTYLVIDPQKSASISRRPKSVGVHVFVCVNADSVRCVFRKLFFVSFELKYKF